MCEVNSTEVIQIIIMSHSASLSFQNWKPLNLNMKNIWIKSESTGS